MAWNEDRIAALTKLWGEGLSASQVARQLGGVSRNAVIGKVHRLGLAGRAAPAACRSVSGLPASRPRPRAVIASMAASAPRMPRPPLPPLRLASEDLAPTASLLTLAHSGCRWPIGDPDHSTFGFCGRDRDLSGPYCSGHAQRAFRTPLKIAGNASSSLDRWISATSRQANAAAR